MGGLSEGSAHGGEKLLAVKWFHEVGNRTYLHRGSARGQIFARGNDDYLGSRRKGAHSGKDFEAVTPSIHTSVTTTFIG